MNLEHSLQKKFSLKQNCEVRAVKFNIPYHAYLQRQWLMAPVGTKLYLNSSFISMSSITLFNLFNRGHLTFRMVHVRSPFD